LNCISKGKIKYFKKDGEVSFRDGYFYEQDIPLEYKTAKRRQRKRLVNLTCELGQRTENIRPWMKGEIEMKAIEFVTQVQ
jgi:hypothetical protein